MGQWLTFHFITWLSKPENNRTVTAFLALVVVVVTGFNGWSLIKAERVKGFSQVSNSERVRNRRWGGNNKKNGPSLLPIPLLYTILYQHPLCVQMIFQLATFCLAIEFVRLLETFDTRGVILEKAPFCSQIADGSEQVNWAWRRAACHSDYLSFCWDKLKSSHLLKCFMSQSNSMNPRKRKLNSLEFLEDMYTKAARFYLHERTCY